MATFESLVAEAKAAGKGWHRKLLSPTAAYKALLCENGRCVLGAVIFGRKIEKPDVEFSEDGDVLSGWSMSGTMEFPAPEDAAYLLGIPLDLAEKIIAANDGMDAELAAKLDAALGVEPEPKVDS